LRQRAAGKWMVGKEMATARLVLPPRRIQSNEMALKRPLMKSFINPVILSQVIRLLSEADFGYAVVYFGSVTEWKK